MSVPDAVRRLESDLRAIFGSRLQSLVVYGGHAHEPPHGPARTMALVTTLTETDLRGCAGRMASWHDAGLATPLLLPAREFERSLDVFPLEFGAIIAHHVVVAGEQPFQGAAVEAADLRRACEVQARSHLLHLREGFMEARGNAHALAVLIVDSAAPLAALLTSVAVLDGRGQLDPEAAGRHAEHALGLAAGTVAAIVALRTAHEIPAVEAERLFPPYLTAMERLVEYVDGWAGRS